MRLAARPGSGLNSHRATKSGLPARNLSYLGIDVGGADIHFFRRHHRAAVLLPNLVHGLDDIVAGVRVPGQLGHLLQAQIVRVADRGATEIGGERTVVEQVFRGADQVVADAAAVNQENFLLVGDRRDGQSRRRERSHHRLHVVEVTQPRETVHSILGHAAFMILDVGFQLDAVDAALGVYLVDGLLHPLAHYRAVKAGLAGHGEQGANMDNVRILRLFGGRRCRCRNKKGRSECGADQLEHVFSPLRLFFSEAYIYSCTCGLKVTPLFGRMRAI